MVIICLTYTSSETSLVSSMRSTPFLPSFPAPTLSLLLESVDEDWDYFQISPHIKAHFIPDGNGAYELVVIVQTSDIFRLLELTFIHGSHIKTTYPQS